MSESAEIDAHPVLTSAGERTRLLSRSDLLPLAVLAGILILLFWRVLFAGEMFFYRDVFSYTYPRARFIHDVVRSRHLPYWNPYFSFGEPVLANPNFLFFYPTTLLIVLLPVRLAYCLHYVLHFGWAAFGAYLLTRRWEQSRLAAFFAAAAFAASGPLLSLGNLYNHVAAAAWIPWALLATDYAVRGRSRRAWILLAGVFALQFLAAEPFTLLATFPLAFGQAMFEVMECREHRLRRVLLVVGASAVVGVLMLGLSGVGLLPALDILHRARRGATGLPYAETVYWSLHPLALAELVLPRLFGSVLDSPTLWTYVLAGRNQPYYVCIFIGFLPIFFAWLGWSEGRGRRRHFVAAAAVLLLLLACGRYTPLFAEAYLLFPPLALVRFPAKLLVPATLLVSVLSGWGVDVAWRSGIVSLRKRTWIVPAALGIATLVIWCAAFVSPASIGHWAANALASTNRLFERSAADALRASDVKGAAAYAISMLRLELPGLVGFLFGGALWLIALQQGKRWARAALPAIVVFAIGHAVWVNETDNPTVPESFYTYRPPVVEQPLDASGPYRYAYIQRREGSEIPESQTFLNFDSIPEARGFSVPAENSFRDRLLLKRGAMLTGVEAAENLDMEGSLPPAYYEFWLYEVNEAADLSGADCLLGRANVKYIVRPGRAASATTREVKTIFNGSPEPSYLYEDSCFLPRAYAVENMVRSRGATDTLSKLSDPGFDARNTVILEASSSAMLPSSVSGAGPTPHLSPADPQERGETDFEAAGKVEIVDRQPNTVTLRADMLRSGFIVLLDRYDPGWRATLDGRPAPVLVANHMFRAVEVSAGSHRIVFEYHQRGLEPGAVLSLITLLASFVAYVTARW
jgi:Bacterial membrane protein YfhO